MTTRNETFNNTTLNVLQNSTGLNFSGIRLGLFRTRVSTGADRPAGYRPGYISYRQSYATKPYINHGVVVRPSESRVRLIYKPDPNYPGFETPHAYTATFERKESVQGLAVKQGASWYNCGTAYQLPLDGVVDPFSAEDQNNLLGKLRERVAGSSFNAGVALGEAPRSLKMIGDTTKQIYGAIKALKKGNVVKAAQTLFGNKQIKVSRLNAQASKVRNADTLVRVKGTPPIYLNSKKESLASNWLALQYGWKPLVSDIYEAAVFIDHQLRNPLVHRVVVRRKAGGRQDGNIVNVTLRTSPTVSIKHRVISTRQIVALLSEVNTIRLSGLTDPASIAWELLPWSFVVDWVIPIGTWLENKSLANALTGTFVTTSMLRITGLLVSPVTTNAQIDSKLNYKGNTSSRVKVVRSVSTSLSIPVPEVRPLSKVASMAHALNGIALLTTLKR